ncbi:hypothetical protein ElyMa_003847800 [Elysia marginata]|uniref:Uncharacterized protein n=1 Tax=Elysia marginata TaxID=1093978 RepID=A0AAV4FH89_9GAST|nr:hypothetical protein ElyMa_003847800 [Elysia marginata]
MRKKKRESVCVCVWFLRVNLKSCRHERLEWVADTWDQARAEILQERHEILNRKLVLQHALVKAQDRRAELRRHLENEAESKALYMGSKTGQYQPNHLLNSQRSNLIKRITLAHGQDLSLPNAGYSFDI